MSNLKLSLKDRLFNTYVFVQLYYSIREIWWGVSSTYLHFGLSHLDQMTARIHPATLVLLGMLGLIGALTKNFTCSLIYSLLNVFVFAGIALTFYTVAPTSSGGGNYTIEMLGAIWLAYQVSHRRTRDAEFQRFIKENWGEDSVNK